MTETKTAADIFYIDGNGKEAIQHYTGRDKSGYLELAGDLARSRRVTRVRISTETASDGFPVGQTVCWYDMKNGNPVANSTSWG